MEDYQLRQDADRGRRAGELLNNSTLKEAFETIEQELTDIWKSTKTNQPELREEAWMSLRSMHRFQAILENWVNNGKIALAEQEKAEARLKNQKALQVSGE